MQWCWVNFQCRGVLLIWIRVGQGPTALAVGAGGGCLDIFSLVYRFSFLSPSFWETARYRLKYCLKGPLNPKQPTNQRWKIFKNLLHTHLPQMFEIRFVALPSGLLPSLFKPRFKGPKWPYPRGSWVWSIWKKSSVSEQLGSDAWKLVQKIA